MGNRAIVIFERTGTDREGKPYADYSPGVYLHWNGGPESVYQFLQELDRRQIRKGDPAYESARFCQIAGEFMDQDCLIGLSLGLFNTHENPPTSDPVGDNGVYIVNRAEGKIHRIVSTWNDERESRYMTPEEIEDEKAECMKSNYWKDGGFEAVFRKLQGDRKLQSEMTYADYAK